ncbi:hypothetical protein IFM89_003265 [Coptis chinensis]|uniref:Uncharacterized protein n=1 Tax=Coptis chinensis TaxID=261450 RepID=A0A835IA08_9MAGN|nr:hypothetical protein IFM89_003265 [Coptis chinensis]
MSKTRATAAKSQAVEVVAENNNKKRRKRVKTSTTCDEFFQEKRNMEDLWKAIFPVGTEDAFEENGVLHGKKVYLFMCTEGTEAERLPANFGERNVIVFPVVVAVVSPCPPSDKIGIAAVQKEAEEIVPMNQMKMDWVPYIPLAYRFTILYRLSFQYIYSFVVSIDFSYRDSQVDRLKSQIFILSCTQRRAALKHLDIERIKKYEYSLPYFYQPFKDDEFEQSTGVDIIFPAEPPVVCEFDWEFDKLQEFTDENLTNENILEDQKDDFKNFVREKVMEAKKANREEKEVRKKAVEEMSEDTRTTYNNIWFYKFYPVQSPDTPDVSSVKSRFISRYYGNAHEVL